MGLVWYHTLTMARVVITEYAAKRLCFGKDYNGLTATPEDISDVAKTLASDTTYVVKVDAGVKKRGKKGLLSVNITNDAVPAAARALFDKDYERVVIEPFLAHEEDAERYVSIDLTRDGAKVLHSARGGIEIENNIDSVTTTVVPLTETFTGNVTHVLPGVPLGDLLQKMHHYHLSFLEINPYVAINNDFIALDMAVEIDSAREAKLPDWVKEHVLHKKAATEAEKTVLELDARTQAALNLHVLNPNGSILTLFSGGGASLVALDSLVMAGLQTEVINYSEYSGAPNREETEAYVATLLGVLFDSKAKNKVILVAGGVANFTDVMATFQGIVDAFTSVIDLLQKQNVYVCVRRGGPNQEAGLAHLRDFLSANNVPHDVHDPSLSLGKVGELVKTHV